MQKILIFSLAYHPFIGGAEIAVFEITNRLKDFSFDMITVNLDGKQKEYDRIGNVNIYRIGHGKISKYFFPYLALRKARELHAINSYSGTWAIMANQAGLAALFFKKKFSQIPFLLTLQEGDSLIDIWLRTFFIRPFYKSIYRAADFIQAISKFLADRAKKMGALREILVIPNGAGFEYGSLQMAKPEKPFGEIFEKNKVIITTSRLVKKNGIDDLIRALTFIDNGNIKLAILGDGPLETKLVKLSVRLGLKQRIDTIDIQKDRVYFFGHVNPYMVSIYLGTSKVFVRPSRSEGLGNSFLEAMLMSIPIVGTKVGGIPDFLHDGQTGWFCEVRNPKSIAEKILFILDQKNIDQVEQVVENARNVVQEKYNWDGISKKMNAVFITMLRSNIKKI